MAVATGLAPDLVLAKTDKGHAEIAHRSHELSQELRSALIQVDGHRTVAKLLATWSQWPGLAAALATLLERGLVAPVGPVTLAAVSDAPHSPKRELIAVARSLLREHSAPVVARLEKSADNLESLRATIDAACKLVMLTIDEKQADALRAAALAILERDR